LYAGQLKLFQIALPSNGEAWERLAGGGFKIKHLLGWPARLPSIECGGGWPAGSPEIPVFGMVFLHRTPALR